MLDPVALWGAITGTLASIVTIRREMRDVRRARAEQPSLKVEHGAHFRTSTERPGEIEGVWLEITLLNTGGRPIPIEAIVVRHHDDRAAPIALQRATVMLPDTPTVHLYVPLAALLAAGFDPVQHPLTVAAKSSDGARWASSLHLMMSNPPRGTTAEQFYGGISRLLDGTDRALSPRSNTLPLDHPPDAVTH